MKKALKFKTTVTAVTAATTMSNNIKNKATSLASCKKSKLSLVSLLDDFIDNTHTTPPHHSAAVGELMALQDSIKSFGLTLCETDSNEWTLLHHAAKGNQVAVMTYLIENGIDLNLRNADGNTALHVALQEVNLEAVSLLMEFGANTTVVNSRNDPPLHTAAREKSGKALEAFISHSVNLSIRGHRNRTILHVIAEEDNIECLKVLHANGACESEENHICLCTKDDDGLTAVHLATKKNSYQVLECFITCKLHTPDSIMNFLDEENSTPLHSAVDAGHLEVVRVLLKYKASPLVVKDDIPPPLHLACSLGRLEMVKAMADSCGLDYMDHTDQNGRTPLHYSAFSIHSTCIMSYITEKGGPNLCVNKQDNKGRTPLHMSVSSGNLTGVKELLARGADPFVKDDEDNNVLHFAVLHNRKAITEALMETSNSDELANEINKKGCSPIHIALKLGLKDIVSLLISSIQLQSKNIKDSQGNNYIHLAASSGDLNALLSFLNLTNAHKLLNETNDRGHTPLHSAAKKGHARCVECLLHSGAMAHKSHKGTSPLMLACREAHIDCAKFLYKAYRFQIDWQDENGDTALHYAARSGSPLMIQQILDYRAEILFNDFGKSFFDEIILSGDENCGLAVVNHRRWQECLDTFSPLRESPMLGLVTHMPDIAKAVLDRCHTIEHARNQSRTETFNFKYLLSTQPDEEESASSQSSKTTEKVKPPLTRAKSRRVIDADFDIMDTDLKTMTMQRKRSSLQKQKDAATPPKVSRTMEVLKRMLHTKRAELLIHPVVSAYLKRKWNTYGLMFHCIHFSTIFFLVLSLTIFVILKPKVPYSPGNSTSDGSSTFENTSSGNSSNDSTLTTTQEIFRWLTIIITSFYAFDTIAGVIIQKWKSINFLDNILVWNSALAIIFIFIFLLAPYPYERKVLPYGSVACFFAWLVLFNSLEFFNNFGLYVNMFFKILRTVFKVLFASSFLLMAFAVSLFVVVSEVPEFSNIGYSLFTVFGYMLGEIQYSFFIQKATANVSDDYGTSALAIIIVIVLAIMLSIVLANLLIGLAVGDIEQIKLNALNQRRTLEVGFFTNLDDWMPKCFQHLTAPKMHVKTYHDKHSSKMRWLMSCFVKKVREEVLDSSTPSQSTEQQGTAASTPADIASEMAQMRRKLQEISDMLLVLQEGAGESRRRNQQCLRWQKPQSSLSLHSRDSEFSMTASDFLPEDLA